MASNGGTSSTTDVNTSDDAKQELAAHIDELLNTLSNKFSGVSSEIFAKMDEMSRRIDHLEAQLKANKESEPGSN
ncbi:heat shock factor binding protein 1-domain-containing protein [Coniochaeta sp. 2T2.1]|nr:heat shock factor binding protein 1-domain-containing protein [Coniochaeta sp. 2T2.1]